MEVFAQTIVLSLTYVTIYLLLGTSVSLIFGIMGVLNFAQGDFMTVTAYVSYLGVVTLGVGWLLSGILILPAAVVVGVLFYALILRPMRNHDPELVLVATFGVGILLQGVVQVIWGGNPVGISRSNAAWVVAGVQVPHSLAADLALAGGALLILLWVLNRTRYGREIRATSQDRIGAALTGVNAGRVEFVSVVLAVVLTGVAGLMLTQHQLLTPQVGADLVLKAFAVSILAGLGRLGGLVPAALVLGFSEALVGTYVSESIAQAAVFGAVVLTLLVRPEGFSSVRLRS